MNHLAHLSYYFSILITEKNKEKEWNLIFIDCSDKDNVFLMLLL